MGFAMTLVLLVEPKMRLKCGVIPLWIGLLEGAARGVVFFGFGCGPGWPPVGRQGLVGYVILIVLWCMMKINMSLIKHFRGLIDNMSRIIFIICFYTKIFLISVIRLKTDS